MKKRDTLSSFLEHTHMQCHAMSSYFKKYLETPCIKRMIVSKVSDQISDITIALEFSKWAIQLHKSLRFLLIKVVS